jgi:hypothetical protein
LHELSGTLMIAFSVRSARRDDQSPRGDVVEVLLPQRGAGQV